MITGLGATLSAAGAAEAVLPTGATPVAFSALTGWRDDDHDELLAAFRLSCGAPQALRRGVERPQALAAVCHAALALPRGEPAREFFEKHFQPYRIGLEAGGFMTGYFEPEFEASLERSADFPVPIYDRPADLVTRLPGDDWPGLDPALSSARRTPAGLSPFPDRAAIDAGALAGQGLEIAWLRDAVDRFVMQVQGSARLRLPDGSVRRLTYSGRNGHAYSSLGRILSAEKAIPPAEMTMDRLVAHLKSDASEATRLIAMNRSFVFFTFAADQNASGPIGGEGVPLTPLRSVAADRTVWPYGIPVWLSGTMPQEQGRGAEPFARAAVIQDTGSAILGPARIDLFYGSGAAAGFRAGLTRHAITLFALWPKPAGEDR